MVEVFESPEPWRIVQALSLVRGEGHVTRDVVEVLVPFLELALVRRKVAAQEKVKKRFLFTLTQLRFKRLP